MRNDPSASDSRVRPSCTSVEVESGDSRYHMASSSYCGLGSNEARTPAVISGTPDSRRFGLSLFEKKCIPRDLSPRHVSPIGGWTTQLPAGGPSASVSNGPRALNPGNYLTLLVNTCFRAYRSTDLVSTHGGK